MTRPLEGYTVALAEGRQLEELAQMLEKEGAQALRCPMVRILDVPDAGPVASWLRDLSAGRFALVILLTGEGVRRLLGFAEREGLRDDFITALGRSRTLTRGPKPGQALKEIGLSPSRVAETPTTEGVIATLQHEDLQGKTVGVQLYGATNEPLTQYLTSIGAVAATVMPYVYAPQSDSEHVADLIERLSQGQIQVIIFTSSPQVERLYEVAGERQVEGSLRQGLERTCVAAVGPVVATTLRQQGARVDICPPQGFVMKNLVQQIKQKVGNRC